MRQELVRLYARTWPHARAPQRLWTVLGVVDLECGCRWDTLSDRMWEPCMTHEAEGHLSALSEDAERGLVVARCLVGECDWGTSQVSEYAVVLAAQEHWSTTRGARTT